MTTTLRRTLGTWDLIMIVVGAVIGSGIFIVPGAVLQQTDGQMGTALVVWLVAGFLSLLGALTYGELGAMKPEAGGLYAYIRDAFGPLPAFLFGWTQFFVISSGTVAALAVAFTAYLDVLVPLSAPAQRLAAVLMIAAVAVINVIGTSGSARVQNWTTGLKAAAIVAFSLAFILLGPGTGTEAGASPAWPDSFGLSTLSAVGLSMIGVLWAYEGWQYVTYSVGEAVDPQRTFPRALVVGTLSLIGIYLLANTGYVMALGAAAPGSTSIAADAMSALFGPTAGKLIAALILVSVFSAANGFTLTAPRVYFAMARDGLFFGQLARVSPRFGTPAFAIVVSSTWAALLAATGTFDQLLTYVVFVGWIFYALGALSIFVYRARQPEAHRPFRVPGYPWTPLLFVAASAAIVLNTIVTQPMRAVVGLSVVALGVPVFLLRRRRAAREGTAVLRTLP